MIQSFIVKGEGQVIVLLLAIIVLRESLAGPRSDYHRGLWRFSGQGNRESNEILHSALPSLSFFFLRQLQSKTVQKIDETVTHK